MKKLLIGMSLILIVSAAAMAQEKKLSSAPQSFRTFFATFKRAVERSDTTAVASMTRFPFSYGYDAGDEGTYSRAAFIRNFRKIFSKGDDFFTNRNPRFGRDDDGTYYISTEDAAHLGFVKTGRTYKFVSYIVEP